MAHHVPSDFVLLCGAQSLTWCHVPIKDPVRPLVIAGSLSLIHLGLSTIIYCL